VPKRLHYLLDVMVMCMRWYVAYPLSLRHIEEMIAERGIVSDHSPLGHQGAANLGEGISPSQATGRPVGP
jgi:putative transposase